MKRNWIYIISPCVIAAVVLFIGLIQSGFDINRSKGWSMLGLIYGIPLLLLVIGIDVVIKLMVKKKVGLLWAIELVLIAVVFVVKKMFG